ncbi:MAG: hypothetical protein Q8911_15095 [Bacillota bacterium]|nr:hypothetical protein [Bacillota bacterium]
MPRVSAEALPRKLMQADAVFYAESALSLSFVHGIVVASAGCR